MIFDPIEILIFLMVSFVFVGIGVYVFLQLRKMQKTFWGVICFLPWFVVGMIISGSMYLPRDLTQPLNHSADLFFTRVQPTGLQFFAALGIAIFVAIAMTIICFWIFEMKTEKKLA